MTDPRASDPLPSLAGADWLRRSATQTVFSALAAKGHAARAVGGAVRNALLGRPVGDIDIATPAKPDEVVAAARAAGLIAVPTGIEHGTITVIADHVSHEVTTLREDVETHGRHATVAFTGDWSADARRRDFTINAFYCSADGEVFDPLDAIADLWARRVRFIGEARERIREDYLRVLRFFRLTAEYGEGPADEASLAACVTEREGLSRLSAERVRQEFLRLLAAPRGPELVRTMQDYGLIGYVLPVAPRPDLLRRIAEIEAELTVPSDPVLRLAALAVEIPEDADRLRERLRLSNDEHAGLLLSILAAPDLRATASEADARASLYAAGAAGYRKRVLMAWTRSQGEPTDQTWIDRYALAARWQPPRFPIRGDDVVALEIPPGPRVGEILRTLEAWWIAGDFKASEADLRSRLKQLVTET